MPRIKITKTPAKLRKYQGDVQGSEVTPYKNMWLNLGKNISDIVANAPKEDAKMEGLVNPGSYNPFDTKWGIQGSTLPDVASSPFYTKEQPKMNQFGQPIAPGSSSPANNKGILNTQNLVNTDLLSQEPKNTNTNTKNKFNAGNFLQNFNTGLSLASTAFNILDNAKEQKKYDKWFRQSILPDNYLAVNTSQDRGDYDVNTGIFRPNQMGFKSKGMQANPQYAQQNFAADGMSVEGWRRVEPANLPDYTAMAIPPGMNNFSRPDSTYVPKPIINRSNNNSSSGDIREVIAQKESGGNYKALPKKKDGTLASSAVGKYQFLWDKNKDWITQVTGEDTKTGFMNSPEAQEKAFDYWDKMVLTPNAKKIKEELGVDAPLNNIKYAIHFAGPKGAYNYFAKGKETNDVFGTSVGKIMNMNLSNNKNMKVRIVGTPDENQMAYGGQPPYSGQTDYGLYIGQRNLYKTMAKHPYEDVKNTVSEEPETPDNPHVLEAEGGETIARPDGSHMMIRGKRHSEGGVKLTKNQAPEGSFIFSDTAKMKLTKEEAKRFGKTGHKKHTPAAVAKQYDDNKYRAILADPNSDDLQKSTAKRMLDALSQKKAELALVQEGKKGFPQGIPDIAKSFMQKVMGKNSSEEEGENEQQEQTAKYGGGLKKYQGIIGGSTVNWQYPVPGSNQINVDVNGKTYVAPKVGRDYNLTGYNPYASIPGGSIYERPGQPASSGAGSYTQTPVRGSAPWKPFVKSLAEKGMKYEDLIKKTPGVGSFVNDRPDVKAWWQQHYKALPGTSTPATDPSFVYQQETTPSGGNGGGDSSTGTTPTDTSTTNITPGDFNPGTNKIPYGWTQQDLNNLGAAALNAALIKKYHMQSRSVQPVLPEFIPQDWRGYAATLQSGANTAAQQLGTYQPGSSMASNLSFLAGQQAENLGKYISGVDEYNAKGATEMGLQRANILNQFSQYNAAKRDYDMDYENTADSKYRAALAHANDRLTAARNQGITNAAGIYNTNLTESPEYYINPRLQKMKFNSPRAYWDYMNRMRGGYQDPSTVNRELGQFKSLYNQLSEIKDEATRSNMAKYFAGIDNPSGKGVTNVVYPNNPMRNRMSYTGAYGANPYAGGMYDYASAYPQMGMGYPQMGVIYP
jgi:hypothetical protein